MRYNLVLWIPFDTLQRFQEKSDKEKVATVAITTFFYKENKVPALYQFKVETEKELIKGKDCQLIYYYTVLNNFEFSYENESVSGQFYPKFHIEKTA